LSWTVNAIVGLFIGLLYKLKSITIIKWN
jgi:hypothetical protein